MVKKIVKDIDFIRAICVKTVLLTLGVSCTLDIYSKAKESINRRKKVCKTEDL